MPLPSSMRTLGTEVTAIETELTNIDTAIAALPATPLEADLPDIVQIVADLRASTSNLQSAVSEILTALTTTRINQ